jgi:hypothetical protein
MEKRYIYYIYNKIDESTQRRRFITNDDEKRLHNISKKRETIRTLHSDDDLTSSKV